MRENEVPGARHLPILLRAHLTSSPKQRVRCRVPLFDYPKMDLNPGVLLWGQRTTPGFKSTLKKSKSGALVR